MQSEFSASGVHVEGDWPDKLKANVHEALFKHIGMDALQRWLNGRALSFRSGGPAALKPGTYYGITFGTSITLYAHRNVNPVINILHEMGHAVDNLWDDYFTQRLEHTVFSRGGNFLAGWDGFEYRGLPRDIIRREALLAPHAGGGDAWQQRGGRPHWEDWADIFANAMIGNLNTCSEIGGQLSDFMRSMKMHVDTAAAM